MDFKINFPEQDLIIEVVLQTSSKLKTLQSKAAATSLNDAQVSP